MFLKNFLTFLMLFQYSCLHFSPFALLYPSHPPFPQSVPTLLSIHGSFIHVLSLVLSPSFLHYDPPPSSPLVTVSLFHISMPMVLFYSLVYFVHQIPLINEIIWYLSFTDWLISLNIIFSSSIHAVTKCTSSFFLLCSIPLCKFTKFFDPLT